MGKLSREKFVRDRQRSGRVTVALQVCAALRRFGRRTAYTTVVIGQP